MTRPIPELLLERYRLGELPERARVAIEREIAAGPGARARLDALARSDAEIHERYVPGVLAALRPRRRSARGLALSAALAAAVLAVLVAMPRVVVAPDDTRLKGSTGPLLTVYRRTPDGSERLA